MSPGAGAARPGRETALAVLFYVAATVFLTWPQAAHLSDTLSDVGDAKLNTRILQWDFRQTVSDPANLFQLNFFHPARYVLAFSENLWGVSLFGFPLLAAGASPLLNYNLLLLLGMFFSALSAWALARYVTGDPVASSVAGLVYAFLPWRLSQLPHIQHQWGGFLCLLVLFLLRYLDRGARRDQALFALCFAWNALSNVHYALFSGFVLAVVLALFAAERTPQRGVRLRGALLAAGVGGLVFLPFAIPYRRAEELYGMKRYFEEVRTYSGRWGDFLSAGEKNRLYGALTRPWAAAEGDFFPGLAAVVLAGITVAKLRRPATESAAALVSPRRHIWARVLDGLSAVAAGAWVAAIARPGLRVGPIGLGDPSRIQAWLTLLVLARLAVAFPGRGGRYMSLGDFLRRGPLPPRLFLLVGLAVTGCLVALGVNTPYYRWLFRSFGQVFRAIRAPSRGIVIFDLALSVLAAWGLSLILRGASTRRRVLATGAAVLLLVVEYRAFPLNLNAVSAQAPPVYGWLATHEFPGAVVEWPLGLIYDFDYVFRQAAHDKPILNGYSGFFPRTYAELDAALKQRPIPDSVWGRMGGLGAGLLVYHSHEHRGIQVAAYADLLDRTLAQGGLELVRAFPHEAGLDFVFIAAGTPWQDRVLRGAGDSAGVRGQYEEAVGRLRAEQARLAPPFGAIHLPEEGRWCLPGSGCTGGPSMTPGLQQFGSRPTPGPRERRCWVGPGLAWATRFRITPTREPAGSSVSRCPTFRRGPTPSS